MKATLALTAYVACIVGANVMTSQLGMVPIGFGLMATAGTYAAGFALLARDLVQDTTGRLAVLGAIAVGGVLSAWLSTPELAFASAAAFLVSELADMAVYTPLRRRGWGRAALTSGVVGSAVDTVVFLALAGFPILLAFPGQMVGKVLWATLLPVLAVLVVRRALSVSTVR